MAVTIFEQEVDLEQAFQDFEELLNSNQLTLLSDMVIDSECSDREVVHGIGINSNCSARKVLDEEMTIDEECTMKEVVLPKIVTRSVSKRFCAANNEKCTVTEVVLPKLLKRDLEEDFEVPVAKRFCAADDEELEINEKCTKKTLRVPVAKRFCAADDEELEINEKCTVTEVVLPKLLKRDLEEDFEVPVAKRFCAVDDEELEINEKLELSVKVGSSYFLLFDSRDVPNFFSIIEKLAEPFKNMDIWKPIEGNFPPFIISFQSRKFRGMKWWSSIPNNEIIRLIIQRQMSAHRPEGLFFLGGKYFTFPKYNIQIVDKEMVSWHGSRRIFIEIPKIKYGTHQISLPFELASKRNCIVQEHKSLFSAFYNTDECFFFFNRKMKFVRNSLIRIGEYNDWYGPDLQLLSHEDTKVI
ncbi:uncharacterized protein LOC122507067 [Leptopilina heterotoma]|uniref:uncharacterized protein LOC122507067 n=1 Tax=Leptopilina heterotoma TaxID=63436 RepID=UPI001CA8C344|nr:uncharacterized protein LOC122507067 [Leptopilina heterotoma]